MSIQEGAVEAKADDIDVEAEFAKIVAGETGQGSDLPEVKPEDDRAKAEAPDGQEETPPADASASVQEPEGKSTDIWATATPEQKAAFEAVQAAARGHARSASQAGRRIAELEASLPKGKGNEAPEGETDEARQERYAKIREDYPDSVAPILDELETLRGQVKELTGVKATIEADRTEAFLFEQYGLLERKHPDWFAVGNSPEFVAWVKEQPGYVQDKVAEMNERIVDGEAAADILTRFKATLAPDPEAVKQADRRAEQLEGNKAVDVRTPPGTGKEEAKDIDGMWTEIMAKKARQAR